MSDVTFQSKNYRRAGGSVWTIEGRTEVLSGGTYRVATGGSIQVESGGVVQIASGGSFVNAGAESFSGLKTVASGGTLQVASGGSIQVAAGGGVDIAGTIVLGGTAGRWAFGSIALTSGTALVYTGLSQIIDAQAMFITTLNSGTGAGSATSFQVNATRYANGTVFFLGLAGTSNFAGAGTITWHAFGY